jgi:ElaB/YqjD/DUF883 family membrane-anchored ribosome-binding protein
MADELDKSKVAMATLGELIAYKRQMRGQKPLNASDLIRRIDRVSWFLKRARRIAWPIVSDTANQIQARPLTAVASALGIGILMGRLLRR